MDPNPIKNHFVLLARVRDRVEPALRAAGFAFDERNDPRPESGPNLWISYRRGAELFNLRFNHSGSAVGLEAEFLDGEGRGQMIVQVDLNGVRSHSELMDRVDRFVAEIRAALPPCTDGPTESTEPGRR